MGLQGVPGPSGSQVWSAFIPSFNVEYTVSTFTPDTPITLTRLQLQLGAAPSGCRREAVVSISDGTPAGTRTITIAGATTDSGALSIDYSAGIPVTIGVSVTAACSRPPVRANVVAQYKAH